MPPNTWKVSTVGAACAIENFRRLPLSSMQRREMSGQYPYFGPTGILDWINEFRIDGDFALIGEDGDHFLKSQSQEMTVRFSGRANVNNHAHIITSNEECISDWFYYYFLHRDITAFLSRQGATRYKLKKADLEKIPIVLPPIPEQREIVRVLDTWSEAVAVCARLAKSSRQQQMALTQQLLTGRRRLPGFDCEWPVKRIGALCTRIQRRADSKQHPLLMISSTRGWVRQDDMFSRYMAGESAKNYVLLKRGEFAYNKGNSKTYPCGCVFSLESFESGLVPHVYVCFRFREEIDSRFYRHYFAANMLARQLTRVINTGVRNNGLLNIRPADFLACEVPVPPRSEQAAIAEILDVAARQVELYEAMKEKLESEKRALMQQLLTGKRRVKLAGLGSRSADEVVS